MSSVQKSIHAAAILALAGLALVTALATNNLLAVHGPTAAVFAFLCLIYLSAGLLTFMRGSDALVRTASVMLGISVFAFVALPFVESRFLNTELYQALSAESMAVWVVLLGLGVAMRRKAVVDRNLTPRT